MEHWGTFIVNEDGSIDIPMEILEKMGYGPNETPLMEVTEDGIVIHKKKPKIMMKKKVKHPKPIL